MMEYEFELPTKLVLGHRSLEKLNYELESLGVKKALILTDKDLVKLGLVERVRQHISIEVVVFSDIPPDSHSERIKEAYDEFFASACDGIISVGGGSVLDSAKVLALMLGENQRDLSAVESYEFFNQRKYPHIAIPTTSGTGSELSHGAVIWNVLKERKSVMAGRALCPNVALIDSGLLQDMPIKLSAATGLDAWTHALESLFSPQHNPLSSSLSYLSWRQAQEYLPLVLKYPKNLDYRLKMAEAAAWVGLSFTHAPLGLAHCLAHSLGSVRKVHHGEAVALFAPLSFAWSAVKAPDSLKAFLISSYVKNGSVDLESLWKEIVQFQTQVAKKAKLMQSAGELELSAPERLKVVEGAELDGTHLFVAKRPEGETLKALLELAEEAYPLEWDEMKEKIQAI